MSRTMRRYCTTCYCWKIQHTKSSSSSTWL